MGRKEQRNISVESHPYTGLVLYEISLDDLNQLENELGSVGEDFTFALTCLTTAVSFTVTLSTVELPAGKLHDVFWVVTILGYVCGAYFGYRWHNSRKRVRGTIARIKERTGPLGEEGKELNSEQLEDLTPAEADK